MLPPLIPHKLPPYTSPQFYRKPKKQGDLAPWWLYTLAFGLFVPLVLFIAIATRVIVGRGTFTDRESGLTFLAWLLDSITWIIYFAAEYKKPGVSYHIPLSVLIYVLAVVGIFLII